MKPSLSKEKKKTWEVFSKYIRLRDALLTTGTLTHAKCVSCQKVYSIKDLQAGHLITRRHTNILFNERNVHAQCYGCNVAQKGNWVGYYEQFTKLYGIEPLEELQMFRHIPKRFTVTELQEMRETYKQKISDFQIER